MKDQRKVDTEIKLNRHGCSRKWRNVLEDEEIFNCGGMILLANKLEKIDCGGHSLKTCDIQLWWETYRNQ